MTRTLLTLPIVFAAFALFWSLFGFLTPTSIIAPQFPYAKVLAIEVAGHLLFGLIVALPSGDREVVLLCGAEAILIDADHILSAVGLPVPGRLAHSVLFVVGSGVLLAYLSKRSGRSDLVAASVVSAVLAHFSYDSFAGDGAFPLLSPFSFHFFVFPWVAWIPFEVAAVMAMIIVSVLHKSRVRVRNRILRFSLSRGKTGVQER